MTDDASNAETAPLQSGRLPALTAKRHASSPFRPVVAEPTEPRDLSEQARVDPVASPAPSTGERAAQQSSADRTRGRVARSARREPNGSKAETEEDLVRLQTLVPFETQIAFKMHCARNRTTINAELRRLLEQFLAKRA